jgi:hypothetical protein
MTPQDTSRVSLYSTNVYRVLEDNTSTVIRLLRGFIDHIVVTVVVVVVPGAPAIIGPPIPGPYPITPGIAPGIIPDPYIP